MRYYPVLPIQFEDVSIEELGFEGPDGGNVRPVSPVFMSERNGTSVLVGTFGARIFYSRDAGETWQRILQASGVLGSSPAGVLITDHPDENRSILAISSDTSRVYRSTNLSADTIDDWEMVLDTPSSGHFTSRYGWSMHGPIIILSTYGDKNAANPPRHLYLSRDYGGTWEEIEVMAIGDMADPANFHLHDVEYDPYSSRIWVAVGDQANGNVLYSDDWGKTFKRVYPSRAIQPTTITVLPDRVIFGSDDMPNGIRMWRRKPYESQAEVRPEDISWVWTPDRIEGNVPLRNVANLHKSPRRMVISKYPWDVLIPFSAAGSAVDGAARVLATPDGESYYEIWRSDLIDPALYNTNISSVLGPDTERRVYIRYYHPAVGNRVVRLKMPEWIKVN